MKAKLLYTVFPCLLLALTCDMGLVARSQEQDMTVAQEEQQTDEQQISYTAGVAQLNDEIALEKEAQTVSLAAGEAEIAQDIIDSDAAELESYAQEQRQSQEAEAVSEASHGGSENEYSNLAIADVNNYVNVRSTPNTEGEIVGKMYDGSVAQVQSITTESDGDWFQVISGEVEGYIKAEFFIYGDAAAEVIDNYVTHYAVVQADRLNVRQEPDTSASRIGYIDHGEKAQIIEYGEEWTKIRYTEDTEGYVASEFITVEEEFIYAKSIAEEQAEQAALQELQQRAVQTEQTAPENTTVVVTPPPTNYTTNTELRSAIVQYAMQYLGTPYVHGGRSLTSGTDCSGFTSYIYAEFGYSLSRTPQGQWGGNGRSISVSEIQPGDIVCYSSNGSKCTHVGIYIGNGQIVHEANSRKGTIVSDIYYDSTFIGVKNVID